MPKKSNITEFIDKSVKKHGNKYDYSLVDYINSSIKVKIVCLKHGQFEQRPNDHIKGQGCYECYNEIRGHKQSFNNEVFINKSIKTHGDKYNYSLVRYKNTLTKVDIICPIHGKFSQTPRSHYKGKGCLKCGGTKKLTTTEFIDKAKKIHGVKYNYSLVEYVNNKVKVKILCEKHGIFEQTPSDHLGNHGCNVCSTPKHELLIKDFLDKNNIKYIQQHGFLDCKNIRMLKFDFYLPNHNICIECDGVQHFKPINSYGGIINFEKGKLRDNIKNDYCFKNNIKLIRIPYYQNGLTELLEIIN